MIAKKIPVSCDILKQMAEVFALQMNVTEDSGDSDTENEEPAPTQPTSSELPRALMTLSSVYSGNMTLTEIEADMIAGKWNAVQKKISDFFAPKC
ncbi:hypothetical protein HPB52_001657 [Rhipicephalus sanguineus]|uniref:Uncharacterized protein n=1 Tax=Rhipicephalus sanguineus TaxID=34632 RepID=A0A9D4T2C7_RHISA|nr:hypothetical protein HPB52_001657 [Rhipicephalus sanguineus]